MQILTKEPRVSADKNYDVECRTSGSRPEAVITWWKAEKQIKKMAQNVSFVEDKFPTVSQRGNSRCESVHLFHNGFIMEILVALPTKIASFFIHVVILSFGRPDYNEEREKEIGRASASILKTMCNVIRDN